MDLARMRPGQVGAIETILDLIKRRQSKISIVLPTRYGKSDVIRISSIIAKERGLCSGSIALSPLNVLRNQLVRGDKIDEMICRYRLPASIAGRFRDCTSSTEHRPFSNGEFLLSSTFQTWTAYPEGMIQLADHHISTMGSPLLIHIDECHETSENKRRGEFVERVTEAGAVVVMYTATAVRADGEIIPGFEVEALSCEQRVAYRSEDAGDGVNNLVSVWGQNVSVVRLKAHHETTFKQAWSEPDPPLCSLDRKVIEVNLREDIDEEAEPIMLSECSPSQARTYLTKIVRNHTVIERAVQLFVSELLMRRRVNEKAAGIIFTCNDNTKEENAHAKEIAAAIEDLRPEFQNVIVTMKQEGDVKSVAQMEKFVGGSGDVLLVKQMAGAGFDAPRVKVILDLSSVRTVASVIQRIMRCATPWQGMRVASVITLNDPQMDAIWRRYVVEEGGEPPTSDVVEDVDLIEQYLKPKEPRPDERRPMEVISADTCLFDDSAGSTGNLAMLEFIDEMFAKVPMLQQLTRPQFAQLLSNEVPHTYHAVPKTCGDLQKKKIAEINARVKAKAQAESPYNGSDPVAREAYVTRIKYWMASAKQHAGVPKSVELKDIVNMSTLDVMMNFLA